MGHADSGTLMAYLDGELPGREQSVVESHLDGCGPCTAELDDLRGMSFEFSTAVALVDGPVPMLRARANIASRVRTGTASASLRRVPADLLKAAAVVLLLAGAASAAIPGSPLRRLVESIVEETSALIHPQVQPTVVEAPEPVMATPPAAAEQHSSGQSLGVSPSLGRARVSIQGAVAGASITVRLVDTNVVQVTAVSSDETRFESGAGFIDVYDNASGVIIEVPRSVASMTVEVDGSSYFVKDGARTRLLGPGSETGPGEFVFQAHSR